MGLWQIVNQYSFELSEIEKKCILVNNSNQLQNISSGGFYKVKLTRKKPDIS